MRTLMLLLLAAITVRAEDFKEKQPSPKARGKLYAWKTTNDYAYLYRVPKNYKVKDPGTLLIIFQGKDRKTVASIEEYTKGRFRDDDILLFPGKPVAVEGGGVTGSVEFKPNAIEARAIRGIHSTFQKLYKIRRTVAYGTGAGGSFALYYGGLYPDVVDSVLADACAAWKDTEVEKEHKTQAVMFMNVLGDPLANVADAMKGAELYRSKGVENVHVSVVFPGAGSFAGDPEALALRLAWCDSMTTNNAKNLTEIYRAGTKVENARLYDYAALYSIAKQGERKRTVERVETIAKEHADAIRASLGENKDCKLENKPWVGHFMAFRFAYAGVPACDELVAELKPALDAHAKVAADHVPIWKEQRADNPQAAFWGCTQIVRGGCLDAALISQPMVADLIQWHRDAQKHALEAGDVKAYEEYIAAVESGLAAYDVINKKLRP